MNRKNNLDISTHVSKFVLDFIESNKDKDLRQLWNTKKIQKEFNTVVNKKYKDKNKPKKCKSCYIYFCEDYRKIIEEKYPNISNKELMTQIGLEWTEVKTNRKDELKKYEDLAAEDKERYMSEMDIFKKSVNDKKDESNDIEEKEKAKPKPRKPRTVKPKVVEPPVVEPPVVEPPVVEPPVKKSDNLEKAKEYFIKKKTKKMKKLQPELSDAEILLKANKKWDKLSDEDRKTFIEKCSS